eukprot:15465841-Alexandrium_andersonii.AAC.1
MFCVAAICIQELSRCRAAQEQRARPGDWAERTGRSRPGRGGGAVDQAGMAPWTLELGPAP